MTEPISQLPDRAQVVIIGGGIIGCSVAYHLAELGWRDVILLERDQLTSGTTWHAAGLMVTFGSMSETSTRLRQYSRDLYARLEAETGQATGFAPVGFIELASTPDRLEEYRRIATFNRLCGVEVHELSPREVGERFPLADTSDLHAGFFVPGDGRVNPVDVTMALARGARQRGVTIRSGTGVRDVIVRDGRVVGVDTDHGRVDCEIVVNCAGMWARQLAARQGIAVPLQAAEHYYLITETIDGLDRSWPVIEDPERYGYYREEVGGLMIGLFEPVCAPWNVDGIPSDASFTSIDPDWDRMAPYVERAMSRVPIAADAGIRTFFCGPESFTPDLSPIVGEAPEVAGYFVAAGLNSIGILTGGGLGRAVAQWIVDGEPDVDVTGMNIDRLQPYQNTAAYRRRRTVESLGMVYQCHYPNRQLTSARDAKRSPFHERLACQGAWFREVSGWEAPDWFAGPGTVPEPGPLTWGRPAFWSNWEAEHRACRERVVLMDMSFMATFAVRGPDAGEMLEWLSANHVDGAPGRITYTQWLTDRGGIDADLTVTKLRDGEFQVVATDTAHRHVLGRLRRAAQGRRVAVDDLTAAVAQLNVQGPLARELLSAVTDADLSNEAFPFRAAQPIEIGYAPVWCARITYLGELGYELFIPVEHAVHVYDRILEAGRSVELAHAGLRALSSLRMEKGYRDYGHDLDNTDSVLEAGFRWAVALDKPGGFRGIDAVRAQLAQGPLRRRLVQIRLLDPELLLYHGEVVSRDGRPIGYLRSASYGHTLGGAVGLAMVEGDEPVDDEFLRAGTWEVEVAGTRVAAVASLRSMYDPDNERIRS